MVSLVKKYLTKTKLYQEKARSRWNFITLWECFDINFFYLAYIWECIVLNEPINTDSFPQTISWNSHVRTRTYKSHNILVFPMTKKFGLIKLAASKNILSNWQRRILIPLDEQHSRCLQWELTALTSWEHQARYWYQSGCFLPHQYW